MARTKKPKAMTRDTMIAMLRTRGVKGRLSKMTKPQLQKMVTSTAPAAAEHVEHAPADRAKGDLELEPDDHSGGHYFRTDGKTVTDGDHDHDTDPWPSDRAAGPKKPKKKPKKKKKVDPIEDPDADPTPELVNARLNKDRHPGTGRKISGLKASQLQFLLLNQETTRLMDNNRITLGDIEQRLDGIDAEYRHEFPNNKFDGSAVDEKNIIEHSRKRSKTDKFADKQPDAFSKDRGLLGKGVPEGSHTMPDGKATKDSGMKGAGSGTYKEYVRHNLKQHGGDMKKCAACYRAQKGGHYAKKDGSVSKADKAKYTHTHTPKGNPQSVKPDADSDDEPEVDFDEEPRQRITRNMDPRQARRQNRGSGMEGDMDGAGFDDLVGEGIMAWLRKHPIIEDVGVGALGVGATLATGGLADLAAGAVGTMAEGLGDAAGAAAEGDSSGLAKGALGSLKKSAATAYKALPGRATVATGIMTEAGQSVFTDGEKDVDGPTATTPPPTGPSGNRPAAAYDSNFQALFGHMHDQPSSGSVWG